MDNTSLEALKSHLFETLEGVKNNNDPEASPCEKCSIEQARQIVDVADSIIDIYKTQLSAIALASKLDEVGGVKQVVAQLGIADTKMLGM